MPPRRPAEYERGEPPEVVRDRLEAQQKLGKTAVEQIIDEKDREQLHKLLDETLDQLNINPGFVKGFKMSQWDGMIKDNEGEIQTQKLRGIKLVAEAKDFQPKWPAIRQIESDPITFNTKEVKRPPGHHQAVILPDVQIGYRRFGDGSVDPFHDERAIDIALQIVKDINPTDIVVLGDFMDLPTHGRFEMTEEYAHTMNLSLAYGHRMLATLRALAPKANIVYLEGNHEKRLEKANKANMLFNFGIRQEGNLENFPVLSIPHLLSLDRLGVKYIEGYPAGKYWLNQRLQVIHGQKVNSSGSTAAKLAKSENASTIMGHIHRIESHYDTQNVYEGGRTNAAFSPGCLCRIDGAVPSYHNGNRLSGQPVKNFENWAQGLAVVSFVEGDGPFNYEQIYINTHENYRTMYRGKVYETQST